MNNDFWVTREAICQWKLLANCLTRDPKIVIHGNSCIILYLPDRQFMSYPINFLNTHLWSQPSNVLMQTQQMGLKLMGEIPINNMILQAEWWIHWNENVVALTKSSSLAALKVVILTTFSAVSDEDFVKMTTFPFQWYVGIWESISKSANIN